jgi:hypothetical protein
MATEAARFKGKNLHLEKEKNKNHLDTNRPSHGRTYELWIIDLTAKATDSTCLNNRALGPSYKSCRSSTECGDESKA